MRVYQVDNEVENSDGKRAALQIREQSEQWEEKGGLSMGLIERVWLKSGDLLTW